MTAQVETFITRWTKATGSELANAQLFISELCALLALEAPHPASDDVRDNAYVFERRVIFQHGDGTSSEGRIDCYRRGHFVLESKKIKGAPATSKGFDDRMQRARGQAEAYARALPAHEGRPPFVVVVDVGHVIELYAEFSQTGATYTPFPDSRSHRIKLDELRHPHIRERLQALWNDPLSLDPARTTAKVTRDVAQHLAHIAKALEDANHPPEEVAGFLTRCLFSMFAEDVGLLPKRSFANLLSDLSAAPEQFVPLISELWRAMDKGDFSVALRGNVLRFNGKLFKQPNVLPLKREHIDLLRKAAVCDWKHVEPAIFGTLLERALNPLERHALGAHYTPRAYVERLVMPTVIEPLRADWDAAKGAALVLAREGKLSEAKAMVRAFHHELCGIRVLDPACGSGNFLYVTLEHMKRLEGEVLNQLEAFGDTQALIEGEGLTVDPHQFLGLEINTRAAAIAELVLWIGYLQWHFRTHGQVLPPVPVLRDFANIENRDALISYERIELVMDAAGKAITRWDGRTTTAHPVTGEPVPDARATVSTERYVKPRAATWPSANFIIGNPPFIGAATMRQALGDGYTEALRATWKAVPESADFVMYWWHHAAEEVRAGRTRRFGLITTNSLRQTFNRRVIEAQLDATEPYPLALKFAVPDHPWVDSAGGAAVRIAMTVGVARTAETTAGELKLVVSETQAGEDSRDVVFETRFGTINADLTVGANVAGAVALEANSNLAFRGVTLMGSGFWIDQDHPIVRVEPSACKPLLNGRDLTDKPRRMFAIDLFGLTEGEARKKYPHAFAQLLVGVKPEREASQRLSYRKRWWVFAEPRPELRAAVAHVAQYIATPMTAKHRTFQFIASTTLPDQGLVVVASNSAFHLGVVSSWVHIEWALALGGRLGVGNDPRYNQSRCFETFPFPITTPKQQSRIRKLAEELDAHRKRQQAAHATLTLTGMYNVLAKLRTGEAITAKEKTIHEMGLVGVLKSLHDELDREVLAAYGWADLAAAQDEINGCTINAAASQNPNTGAGFEPTTTSDPATRSAKKQALTATLLTRLVELNLARAAEEKTGTVHWLRPEYQAPAAFTAAKPHQQGTLDVATDETASTASGHTAWPATLPAQIRAIAQILTAANHPLSAEQIARSFGKQAAWAKRLTPLLESLEAMGHARRADEDKWLGV